ncbi:kelch-like protein 4 [Octopus sinensis]|uniref:Kelch-like protein 4 n=1 Tax=Octopus sinensis TaxID=2607531 RepID=A0A6P7U2H7_9MOLL|nr:kelch-like protein 4 [Octopus sinensis]
MDSNFSLKPQIYTNEARPKLRKKDLIISINTGDGFKKNKILGASDASVIYCLDPNFHPLSWKPYRICEHVENVTDFEINFLNNSILIIGGKSINGRSLSSIMSLNISTSNTIWHVDTEMIPSRYGCAVAIEGSRFVITGGCQCLGLDKDFEDFQEMLLCERVQLTKQVGNDGYIKYLTEHGPLFTTDILEKERVLRCVEILDEGVKWEWLQPLPFSLMNHAVAFHQGIVYISGGQLIPGGPALHLTLEFNENSKKWVEKSNMLISRAGHRLISYDMFLLAVGGEWQISGRWSPVYFIEKYDVVRNDWSILTCVQNPRSHLGTVLYFHKLFVVSGYKKEKSEFVMETDIFDLMTKRWYEGPIYPSKHKPKCLIITENRYD